MASIHSFPIVHDSLHHLLFPLVYIYSLGNMLTFPRGTMKTYYPSRKVINIYMFIVTLCTFAPCNTVNTRIKEPVIFHDRLTCFLYIGCIVINQPKEVLN
jgi:membrane associated rhomboid family serine protease